MVPQGRRGQGPRSGRDMGQEQGSGAGAEKMRCRGPLGCRRQRVPARQAETESFRESLHATEELFRMQMS